MKCGLVIFAREPLPGRVKSRLAASIGDHYAAELYETMLSAVLKMCRQLTDVDSVVFWDCEEDSLQLLAERYNCCSRRQIEGDLGQRMQAALSEMFASGSEICCIIGSDAPDLPASFIKEAFYLLTAQQADAVFGPCHDGGYYLLGLSRLWPQLFADIDWGTPQVLQQSLLAAEGTGIKVSLLLEWYDIDTYDDLKKFRVRKKVATCNQS